MIKIRTIAIALCCSLLVLFFPGPSFATQGEDEHGSMKMGKGHEHREMPENAPGVGLEEKIGSRIPLDVTFTDSSGETVRLADLVDGPTIIAPVYYRCPNVCNFLQTDLARVLPDVGREPGEEFEVVSISFDETETPELAARSKKMYMQAMREEFPEAAWHFLTGEREQILKVTDAAGYRFRKMNDGQFLHPVVVFVVDSEGKIIRYLHGTRFLPKDLTLALFEAEKGRAGTTIRKVVQYCFSFDPEQKTYVFNILKVSATVILTTLALFLAFLVLGGKKNKRGSKS